jgi:hypothetical protein
MANNNLDERASTTGQIYPKENANPNPKQKETIFILCESCYWSATYFGKFMLPAEERCPICLEIGLSSFPVLPNESFIFNYSQKCGVELEFSPIK